MANRMFQDDGSLIKGRRILYCVVSVGAAGAVTLKKRTFNAMGATSTDPSTALASAPTSGNGYVYGNGQGIRSVARTDTGDWTITLSDPYQYLLGVYCVQVSNTTGAITSPLGGIGIVSGSTDVTTNTAVGNGGVIAITLNNGSGTATDPADGDTLTLCIELGDSSSEI